MEITVKVEVTGVDVGSGQESLVSFKNHLEWVNKAPNWVRSGYTLIDSDGKVVRSGGDAKAAKYPVSVYRMVGAGDG